MISINKRTNLILKTSQISSKLNEIESRIRTLRNEKFSLTEELENYEILNKRLEKMDRFFEKYIDLLDKEDIYVKLEEGLSNLGNVDLDTVEVVTKDMIDQNTSSDTYIIRKAMFQNKECLESEEMSFTDVLMTSFDNGVYMKIKPFMREYENDWNIKYGDNHLKMFEELRSDDIYEDVVIIKPTIKAFDLEKGDTVGETIPMETIQIHFNDMAEDLKNNGIDIEYNEGSAKKETPFASLIEAQKEHYDDMQFLDFIYSDKNYYNNLESIELLEETDMEDISKTL